MLALVFGFFAAFIQSVFAFVRPEWVSHAGICHQAGEVGVFRSTVFAVVVHGFMLVAYMFVFVSVFWLEI